MRTISHDEYLQLAGLLALADHHNRQLADLCAAAQALTGEADEYGHTWDAVFNSDDGAAHARAITLLRRLGLTVEEDAAPCQVVAGGAP